ITVKKGDTLEKIARANGTTIKKITEANQLKNDTLSIGQTLRVPVSSEKKTTAKKPLKASEVADAQYHTVKTGDNPWKIAKQYNIKVDELLKWNNLDEEKARNLKIGDKLKVK